MSTSTIRLLALAIGLFVAVPFVRAQNQAEPKSNKEQIKLEMLQNAPVDPVNMTQDQEIVAQLEAANTREKFQEQMYRETGFREIPGFEFSGDLAVDEVNYDVAKKQLKEENLALYTTIFSN